VPFSVHRYILIWEKNEIGFKLGFEEHLGKMGLYLIYKDMDMGDLGDFIDDQCLSSPRVSARRQFRTNC